MRTIALARIAVGAMFVLFGEYKLAGPKFATEGFAKYLDQYVHERRAA